MFRESLSQPKLKIPAKTLIETRDFDIISNKYVSNHESKCQVWLKTHWPWSRVDFVLLLSALLFSFFVFPSIPPPRHYQQQDKLWKGTIKPPFSHLVLILTKSTECSTDFEFQKKNTIFEQTEVSTRSTTSPARAQLSQHTNIHQQADRHAFSVVFIVTSHSSPSRRPGRPDSSRDPGKCRANFRVPEFWTTRPNGRVWPEIRAHW